MQSSPAQVHVDPLVSELAPRFGNTGGKCSTVHWEERSITVDWIRVTHPEEERESLQRLLERYFGEAFESGRRWFYTQAVRFEAGPMLLWESRSGNTCCVDVNGSALASLDWHDRMALVRQLMVGGRATRFDLAVDAKHGERVGLIDCMLESCFRGELCGARVFEPKDRYRSGELEAYGVNIGRRGKNGSGRYVRCYDKGLETGTEAAGRWERLEVEFTDDCANEVAIAVCSGDFARAAFARVCGACSFREVTGQGAIARRPMKEWWADWTSGSLPRETVARRQETTLRSFISWTSSAVLPTLARLADETGERIVDVIARAFGDESGVRRRPLFGPMRPMLAEYRRWVAAVEHPAGAVPF